MRLFSKGLKSAVSLLITVFHLTTSVWAQAPLASSSIQDSQRAKGRSFKQVRYSAGTQMDHVQSTDGKASIFSPAAAGVQTFKLMAGAQTLAAVAAAVAPAAPAYNFDAVADTRTDILGTKPIGGLGLPSINDTGKVAFTAQYTAGGRPFIVLKDLSTNQVLRNFQYGAPFTASNFIQVNNLDQIAFRVGSDDGLVSYLNRLDGLSSGPGIATGSLTPALVGNYDVVLPYPSLNNSGLTVFSAQKSGGTLLSRRAGGTGAFDESIAVAGNIPMFPMVSDQGDTVWQFGNNNLAPLIYSWPNLATRYIMASTTGNAGLTSQFIAIGNKPGISDDGNVIGFMANHSTLGNGVFLYVWDPVQSTYLGPVLAVATPPSGSLNYRVGINKVNPTGSIYTVTFLALNGTSVLGLYSENIDISTPTALAGSPLSILAQVGQKIAPFNFTVQDINMYDPVNNKGQVAFWVKSTDGLQAIMRATPKPAPAGGAMASAPINNPDLDADPLFTHSGQFYFNHKDITIPGREMDLTVKHHYRATTATVSRFGFGWNMTYNERLNVVANNAEISDSTGRKDVYTLTAGVYVPPKGFYQTLVKNADATWTLTEANGTKKTYDNLGRLSRMTDRNGNAIVLAYASTAKTNIIGPLAAGGRGTIGSDYQLVKITGTNGRFVDLTYNADGLLSTIKEAATSRTVTFTYNAATNDLLQITSPATTAFPSGISKIFTYDTRHNLLTVKDGKGQTYITNTYLANDKLSQQTYGSGSFTFAYETGRTTVTDRRGFVSLHEFNAAGNLTRLTQYTKGVRTGEPSAFITNYTYNADMEKLSDVYPNGNGVFYKYDSANTNARARGNLLEVRRKSSAAAADNDTNDIVVKYTYEANFNQVKTITDALGRVTTFTYDYQLATTDPRYGTKGNVVKIEQPAVGTIVPTTWFKYNANGQTVEVQDPNGNITQMAYDAVTGYLLSVASDPTGINAVTQFAYDSFGNVNKITDANLKATTLVYNQLGWLLSATDALARQVKYTYDANGNVTREERQSNAGATTWQTTDYTYDLLNHVKTIKDPLLRVTTFNYDNSENLISVVDPKPNTTSYAYDERDLLFKVTDANAGVTQYDYDLNGRLITLSDAKANKTVYSYDGFDRLTKMTYPDTAVFEQYTYDKNSNLTQKITPNNLTITYAYDTLNRLTAQTYADTTMNVTRTYDIGSRLTKVTNSFSDVTFGYDKLNRVASETQKFGTLSFAVTSVYDKAGNRTKVTYPSTKNAEYVYNGINQVTNVKVNTVALANYTYDVLNRLAQKDLVPTAVKSAIYGYDVANQLLTVDNKITPAATLISKHTYTYDTAGNRLTHSNQTTAATKAHTFTYNNIYELTNVTGAQTHTYAYDKLGNRTTADAVTYVTNNLNQYSTVGGVALTYDKNGNTTKDNAGVLYVYDAENRLTQMTKGTVIAKYRYDGLNRRISKEIGTAKTFYVHDGDEVVEERNATGGLVADYVYGPGIDEVLTMTRGANTYYYFYDALGSVRQITNAAGTISETYDYDVFGKPLNTSAVGNPVMFTGRWFDPESGNFYYRARYYQPTLGRFLQRDPIGYFGGKNLYSYVKNNSINYIDPSGRVGIAGGIFGGISGGVGGALAGYHNNGWNGAITGGLIGAAIGAIIGVAAPQTSSYAANVAVEAIVSGGLASYMGQVVSNVVNGAPAFSNISVGAIIGATGAGLFSGVSVELFVLLQASPFFRLSLSASTGGLSGALELVGKYFEDLLTGKKPCNQLP